jgi:hypothetical protein
VLETEIFRGGDFFALKEAGKTSIDQQTSKLKPELPVYEE